MNNANTIAASLTFQGNPFPVFSTGLEAKRKLRTQLKNLGTVATTFRWNDVPRGVENEQRIEMVSQNRQTVVLEKLMAKAMNFLKKEDDQVAVIPNPAALRFIDCNEINFSKSGFKSAKAQIQSRIQFLLKSIVLEEDRGVRSSFQRIEIILFILNVQRLFLGNFNDDLQGIPDNIPTEALRAQRAIYRGRINKGLQAQIAAQNRYAEDLFTWRNKLPVFEGNHWTVTYSEDAIFYVAALYGLFSVAAVMNVEDNRLQTLNNCLQDLYDKSKSGANNGELINSNFWFLFSPIALYMSSNRRCDAKKVLASLYAVAWIKNDPFFQQSVANVRDGEAPAGYVDRYKNCVLPVYENNWLPAVNENRALQMLLQ